MEGNLTAPKDNDSAGGHQGAQVSLTYEVPVMIVVAILLSVLTLMTVVGNLLVGLALMRYPRLRTVSNYLIGNLALSDLLLAVTVLPLRHRTIEIRLRLEQNKNSSVSPLTSSPVFVL